MLAVSVAGGLDRPSLAIEGDPGKANAVRERCERRWTEQALKSGKGVEDRQFDDADDLRKCLAFDAVAACRIFDVQRMARDKPNAPAAEVVDEDEIAVPRPRRPRHGQEQGSARKPRHPVSRG